MMTPEEKQQEMDDHATWKERDKIIDAMKLLWRKLGIGTSSESLIDQIMDSNKDRILGAPKGEIPHSSSESDKFMYKTILDMMKRFD